MRRAIALLGSMFAAGCLDSGGGNAGSAGAAGTAGASGGAGSDAGAVDGLNQACSPIPSQNMPCPAPLTCGDHGEQVIQCVIEGCPSAGPGPAHGCPDGAYCNVFDGDEGHYCTRTCDTDSDCGNPSLRCVSTDTSELFGVKICVF